MKTLLLAIATLAAGCIGTETGNPSFALVAIDTHSSDPESVSVRAESAEVVIDQAWISFGAIELAPECAGAGVESDVLGAGDHSEPGPLMFEIALDETASFSCLRAPFAPIAAMLPAGAPPELDGRAIVILGHLADMTPVRIVSAFERDVIVEGSIALTEDAPGLLLGLDMARWVSSVDLGGAVREGDGSVVLDDTRNTALRDALDARVPEGVELYRDEDADGVLDTPPVLIGRGST